MLHRLTPILLLMLLAACAGSTVAPTTPPQEPTPFPQPYTGATFPVPPKPTSTVELVLPAPLPTPGGPLTAYPSLNGITDLAFAPNGSVWTSGTGVARLTGLGGPRLYTTTDGLPANGVVDLAVGPDGALWAVGSSGVARLDGNTWTNYELGIPDAQIKAIAPSAGTVWLAASRGVFRCRRLNTGKPDPEVIIGQAFSSIGQDCGW